MTVNRRGFLASLLVPIVPALAPPSWPGPGRGVSYFDYGWWTSYRMDAAPMVKQTWGPEPYFYRSGAE